VKRALILGLLVAGCLAGAYGYAVTSWENDHRELIRQGDTALSRGDLSSAIEAFSGAITLRSDSMIGYLKRGDAYRRRDELEAAVRDLKRAVEIDPSATRPRELLGDVNSARNRFLPAIEHYEAYVALDDRSPRVLYKLALARYRAGQPALGIEALDKAVAIDGRFAEAYYLKGLCQRDAQRPGDALISLQRAIALAPAMLPAREELADLYEGLGRSQDWFEQLEGLRALDPGAHRDVTLGLAYSKAGQSDRAVILLRETAERYPKHRHTFLALGRVWLETAQARADRVELSKAREALELAISLEDTSEAYTLYGRALLLSGEVELAERMLLHATQKLPVDALAFYHFADAADRRGRSAEARQALFDYLALDVDEVDNRRRMSVAARIADLSVRLGDFPAAVTHYERAAPQYAGDPDFLVRFAEARWRAGQPDAARGMLEKLLERDPLNAGARGLLRRIPTAKGQAPSTSGADGHLR
jgi:tetratricopeptide (TPR) repeat protein